MQPRRIYVKGVPTGFLYSCGCVRCLREVRICHPCRPQVTCDPAVCNGACSSCDTSTDTCAPKTGDSCTTSDSKAGHCTDAGQCKVRQDEGWLRAPLFHMQ